jgi:hypothetical protein
MKAIPLPYVSACKYRNSTNIYTRNYIMGIPCDPSDTQYELFSVSHLVVEFKLSRRRARPVTPKRLDSPPSLDALSGDYLKKMN